MGMLSACANPIIYGFLNENFHREFTDLFKAFKSFFSCKSTITEEENLSQNLQHETRPALEQPLIQIQQNGDHEKSPQVMT